MTTIRTIFAATLTMLIGLAPSAVLAQPDFEEAPIIEIAGVRYSTLLTVKFSVPAITGIGQRTSVDVSDIDPAYNDLIGYFNDLETEYGTYDMEKVFPGADWGENTDVNIRTGQTITVHDRSQVFRVDFSNQVPIDTLITEFEQMSDIMWVDEPAVLYFGDSLRDALTYPIPNDPTWLEIETNPDFQFITDSLKQWGVRRVGAPYAWDISKGVGTTVALIDFWDEPSEANYPGNSLHPDLGNDPLLAGNRLDNSDPRVNFKHGGHGLLVASVAGSITDNGLWMASLGWKVSLRGYSASFIAESIAKAACLPPDHDDPGCDPVDAFNMSFISTIGSNAWREAIQDALKKGVIAVAAAGNYHEEFGDPPYVTYPCAYAFPQDGTQVICVSATAGNDHFVDENIRPSGNSWNFSHCEVLSGLLPDCNPVADPENSFVDVAAPGYEGPRILVTNLPGDTLSNGTVICPLAGIRASGKPIAGVHPAPHR